MLTEVVIISACVFTARVCVRTYAHACACVRECIMCKYVHVSALMAVRVKAYICTPFESLQ